MAYTKNTLFDITVSLMGFLANPFAGIGNVFGIGTTVLLGRWQELSSKGRREFSAFFEPESETILLSVLEKHRWKNQVGVMFHSTLGTFCKTEFPRTGLKAVETVANQSYCDISCHYTARVEWDRGIEYLILTRNLEEDGEIYRLEEISIEL